GRHPSIDFRSIEIVCFGLPKSPAAGAFVQAAKSGAETDSSVGFCRASSHEKEGPWKCLRHQEGRRRWTLARAAPASSAARNRSHTPMSVSKSSLVRDIPQVIGVSPFESPDVRLVCAFDRAGALGVLDLGHDAGRAREALAVVRHMARSFG